MWSFILCVSLTRHRLPRWNIASECVCEGVSRWDSCFNQETELSGLPSPVWQGLSLCCEGLDRVRGGGGGTRLSFSASLLRWNLSVHIASSAPQRGFTPSAPRVLRPWSVDWRTPPAFLGLQLADSRPWDFSASITKWVNSYVKKKKNHTLSLSVYKYNLLVLFLSGES